MKDDDLIDFRQQCERGLQRSVADRMRYGFCYVYKPVLDDAPWRSLDAELTEEIVRGKGFVQIKSGPFDIDLVFAPDGIESYEKAKRRMDTSSGFPVLNIRDIIASKRSAGRPRDEVELPLLEAFREVYEKCQE